MVTGNFSLFVVSNMGKSNRTERKIKPSTGHPPEILRKGSAHRDRTKYTRKQKHVRNTTEE